jgi:hypothetical protein
LVQFLFLSCSISAPVWCSFYNNNGGSPHADGVGRM